MKPRIRKTEKEICDPELMKKVIEEWHSMMFEVLNTEAKRYPQIELLMRIHKVLSPENRDLSLAYSHRAECVMSFVAENIEKLKSLGLIKEGSFAGTDLIATIIFEAAATCPVGNKSFDPKKMFEEIQKYRDLIENEEE